GEGVGHAVRDGVVDGRVEGGRDAPAQAHVGDGGGARGVVLGHPVDSGDHAGVGAAAVAVEHAHGHQAHVLGDAVRLTADGPGDVGAVAVAVLAATPVVDGRVARDRASAELRVCGADAGVDDVRRHAGA